METSYTLIPSPLGAVGIAWGKGGIRRIALPVESDAAMLEKLRQDFGPPGAKAPPPAVRRAIELIARQLRGEPQDLSALPLDMGGVPDFHRKVYQAARAIPSGETLSYGQLAERAGSPGAARAVGQAMARNPFSIVVPCHRVVAANGGPGGFTSTRGLQTKAELLRAEGTALFRGSAKLPYDAHEAVRRLCEVDPKLAAAIARVGPPRLKLGELHSPFDSLLQSIVYQQLNGKAAATILGRVRALFANNRPTPERVKKIPARKLRAAGLSKAKTAAVKDLAQKALDGTVPSFEVLRRLSDDEIVERLTLVRGVGRWTVEMLLMFRLGRPDVLPIDDYAVRKGFAKAYGKRALPTPKQLAKHGQRWRPYRSVASWYLWRVLEV
jgi:methylated-DNA-[protein]-cysteine S-methyltransferase